METPVNYLFVYGTLMQGHSNSFAEKLHRSCHFEGNGYFPGLLYQIDSYPGAISDSQNHLTVKGEIYSIKGLPNLIAELDDYEDVFEDECASLYVRKIVSVTKTDESTIDCWVYLYNQSTENLMLIANGDFRSVLNNY